MTQCTYCKTHFDVPTDDAEAGGIEDGWTWCTKCDALVYDDGEGTAPCAGGGTHALDPDSHYVLSLDEEDLDEDEIEAGWEWCKRCNCLFAGGRGVCAAGGAHDGSDSGDYALPYEAEDDDEGEDGWTYCEKCDCLVSGAKKLACAAGGRHEHTDDEYAVWYADD